MAIKSYQTGKGIPTSALRVLLYGDPNIGKTTLAASCKRPLVFDFDAGAHRAVTFANGGLVLRVESWSDVMEVMRDKALLANHDTIVLDTVGTAQDYMVSDMIRLNPKMGNGKGSPSMQGWQALSQDFKAFVREIQLSGKDLVMLAHAAEDKDGDNVRLRPKAQGQSKALIMEVADYIGYVHSVSNRRTVSFTFTDAFHAKDVRNTMGVVSLDDINANPNIGADMLTKMRNAFASAQEASKALSEQVGEWKAAIDSWAYASDFTANLAAFQALPKDLSAPVGALIKARREALGITYDAATKQFVAPVQPAEPVHEAVTEAPTQPVERPATKDMPAPVQTVPAPVTVPAPAPRKAAAADAMNF